jgi:hypothetical protein
MNEVRDITWFLHLTQGALIIRQIVTQIFVCEKRVSCENYANTKNIDKHLKV